jgi:hypothetical protein
MCTESTAAHKSLLCSLLYTIFSVFSYFVVIQYFAFMLIGWSFYWNALLTTQLLVDDLRRPQLKFRKTVCK